MAARRQLAQLTDLNNVPFSNIGVPPLSLTAYPPWGAALIRVVEQALSEAWLCLIRDHSALVLSGNEDVITNQLLSELAALWVREYPLGFNPGIFGMPSRDGKLSSWDGQSIDQMPDITIYPAVPRPNIASPRHDALFFECKVLDKNRGMNLYRSEGIERFTQGRYAWRMPHAGMVAYVFDKSECSSTTALTNYFARNGKAGTTVGHDLGVSNPPIMAAASKNKHVADIAETRHLRTAPVVHGTASEITLRHLWLLSPEPVQAQF